MSGKKGKKAGAAWQPEESSPDALVYGYTRVSTEDQSEGNSPETQRHIIEEYARTNPKLKGLRFAGHYDDVISGATPLGCRPMGARLLLQMERGDHLVVSKMDRIFRSASDLCISLDLFAEKGHFFHAVDFGMDTRTRVGKMMAQILASFAEFERGLISERIRDGMAHCKREGLYTGGVPPYGKLPDPRTGKLVPDPHARAVGKHIVQWKLEGFTWEEIYWHLLREGVRKSDGKEWQIMSIRRAFVYECQAQAAENAFASDRKKPK